MNTMNNDLEVWLDCDLCPMQKLGMLSHDRGQVRFFYDREWLKQPIAFSIDPQLSLDAAPFFPKPEAGNFGIFLDSSPDRWGQALMRRREFCRPRMKNGLHVLCIRGIFFSGCRILLGRGPCASV